MKDPCQRLTVIIVDHNDRTKGLDTNPFDAIQQNEAIKKNADGGGKPGVVGSKILPEAV